MHKQADSAYVPEMRLVCIEMELMACVMRPAVNPPFGKGHMCHPFMRGGVLSQHIEQDIDSLLNAI
jgi:hypothetical protein